jgi:DNA-binding transcriptional LysR family regulator
MYETATDYQLLSVFVAVAKHQSFTQAAQQLGIGKGTVSRAIAELEQALGAELIHRTTHAFSLSTAGVALYERTAPHLAALDQAVSKLPERAAEPSGHLRMTAPPDLGNVFLPDLLAQFCRRYPQIHVEVRLTTDVVNLVAAGFDVAIRATPGTLKDSSLTVRRLGQIGMGFFGAPSYFARRGKPKQFGQEGHDWLLHAGGRAAASALRGGPARFVCDDFLLLRNVAAEGAGVAMLPHRVALSLLEDGRLEEVTLPGAPSVVGNFFLLYPSSGEVPRKVTAFRDFLIDWLKKSPLA